MLDQLLHWDDPWTRLALDVTLKATLLLAAAATVVLLSGRLSAALRHRVLALLFVALLLLPAASLALPQLALPIIPRAWLATGTTTGPTTVAESVGPVATDSTASDRTTLDVPAIVATPQGPTSSTRADEVAQGGSYEPASNAAKGSAVNELRPPSAAAPTHRSEPTPASTGPAGTRYPRGLKLVWLVGTVLVLLPLISGMLGNLRFKRRGRPLVDPQWQRLLDDLRRSLALRREATLLIGDTEQMPMTFGWTRPCIVLPAAALAWSDERRRVVLLHELAHIKRYDVPWQMVARLACAVYWFHPLAWWALRRMRLDREHACDDCVLTAGQKASHYASQLLEIARVHRACSPLTTAALSMARRSQLEGRLAGGARRRSRAHSAGAGPRRRPRAGHGCGRRRAGRLAPGAASRNRRPRSQRRVDDRRETGAARRRTAHCPRHGPLARGQAGGRRRSRCSRRSSSRTGPLIGRRSPQSNSFPRPLTARDDSRSRFPTAFWEHSPRCGRWPRPMGWRLTRRISSRNWPSKTSRSNWPSRRPSKCNWSMPSATRPWALRQSCRVPGRPRLKPVIPCPATPHAACRSCGPNGPPATHKGTRR